MLELDTMTVTHAIMGILINKGGNCAKQRSSAIFPTH
jgi:hypothetical protein